MAPKQPNSGLFVGLNKGHIVTKRELPPRPSDRKGVRSVFLFTVTKNSMRLLLLGTKYFFVARTLNTCPENFTDHLSPWFIS